MKFSSTRGGSSGLSFEEALFSGFTPDGGILLPECIPTLDEETIESWARLSYPEISKRIARIFISPDEIPNDDLSDCINAAFTRFSTPDVVKLAKLNNGLNILELFHGPTLAFKDLALSCVGQLIQYFLNKRQSHVTILVGTSGDTGSAAIESVRGLSLVDIIVLLPRGRCTKTQELQMTTVIEPNVHVFRVDGSSDDLDVPIKDCFMDVDFTHKHHLCSINSINWVRIMSQMAHYFYAYFQVRKDNKETVEIVVPTGACGNVTAGLICRLMGLPIKLVCAVNRNDIVARAVQNADFSVSDYVTQTLAPAMDIQMPYNMERLVYLLTDGDTSFVKSMMTEVEDTGNFKLPNDLHKKLTDIMDAHSVNDEDIKSTMKQCFDENKYLLCPHTAVAVHTDRLRNSVDSSQSRICLATASPDKFEETVKSVGIPQLENNNITSLRSKPTRFFDLEKTDDWSAILRDKISSISDNISR